MAMKVLLAKPRGFCAGVERAISVVEMALKVHGRPVHVRKEIVHNRFVVEDLRRQGAVFVDEVSEVPEGSDVVFSAHGVAPAVLEEAKTRQLRVIDATCPLVTKVHMEARRFLKEGCELILVGHPGHEEVTGTMGEAPGQIQLVTWPEGARKVEVRDPAKVAVLTQTTLSTDDAAEVVGILRSRFPSIRTPSGEDVCYATRNRQLAVKAVAQAAGTVLVVGANNSSNSKRLREVAEGTGARAFLVNHVGEIDWNWFEGINSVGVTAGASAPDGVVRELVNTIVRRFGGDIEEIETVPESVHFALPAELGAPARPGRTETSC